MYIEFHMSTSPEKQVDISYYDNTKIRERKLPIAIDRKSHGRWSLQSAIKRKPVVGTTSKIIRQRSQTLQNGHW